MNTPAQYTATLTGTNGAKHTRTYSNECAAYAFFRMAISNSWTCRVMRAEYAPDSDSPSSIEEVTAIFADRLQGVA